ncbi:glycoside hydrolase superfamily [Amylocarpus encephaloides]|uniref:chitinase n=1 Tax=Amylocarpus encephaloides TaxID=45428 RepID=A0A9P8BZ69_9HELO|nr:glycoside hydrolase superfamily [Amylocarpus encephaloides]
MLWAIITILLSATCKLGSCNQVQGYSLSDPRDVSNNATYLSVAYYVNWAVYDRAFYPKDLPVDKLTHVLYAFANISPQTGEVYLSDTFADTEANCAGDSSNEAGENLSGCLNQLYLLKKSNRNLKVLLSIGGSTYSANFAAPLSTASGRSTFASTAVILVGNFGFDGLDIDWEYPQNDIEAANMVLLLQAIREALDAYGNSLSTPHHFQLTVACPAGQVNYQTMHLASMDQYLDFWNLMAFDYSGSWSAVAADQANLFSGHDLATTPFDTRTAVSYYLSQGIPSKKFVLGMPVYGRSFEATDGPGKPYDGIGNGTWQPGVYDFKSLPLSGAVEIYSQNTGASYSYDAGKRELISYDTVAVAKQKAAYIQQEELGGAMWWESSADGAGNNSLIQNVVGVLGGGDGSTLASFPNQLSYPNSTYDNLRAGVPESGSSSATAPASTDIVSGDYLSRTAATQSAHLGTISTSTTCSFPSIINSTSLAIDPGSTTTEAVPGQSPSSSVTNTPLVPGKNGVPGCAYITASNMGPGAMCQLNYCNCGGTAAPLLTSTVSDIATTNCNYQTQPATRSCPTVIPVDRITVGGYIYKAGLLTSGSKSYMWNWTPPAPTGVVYDLTTANGRAITSGDSVLTMADGGMFVWPKDCNDAACIRPVVNIITTITGN